jgi:hypothetical protein
MADTITVDVKQAQKEIFKLRARFSKLQRIVIAEALFEASAPLVAAAQAAAPTRTGRLRGRIAPTLMKRRGIGASVGVSPVRLSKKEKLFPFYGRFQEMGWKATGRATRKSAKRYTVIAGKHFLRSAGQRTAGQVEKIFAARIFQRFAEIQSAGESAGIV